MNKWNYFLEDFFGVEVFEVEMRGFLDLATTFFVLGLAPTFLLLDRVFFVVLTGFFVTEVVFFPFIFASFFSEGFLMEVTFLVFEEGIAATAIFAAVLGFVILLLGCSFSVADNLKEAFTLVNFPASTPLFRAFRRRCY